MLNNEETILNKFDYDYTTLYDTCDTVSLSYALIPLNFVLFYLIWNNRYDNEYLLLKVYNIIWEIMRICSVIYIWTNNNLFQPIYICIYDNCVNRYTIIRDGREIIKFNEKKYTGDIVYCALNHNLFNDDIVYYTDYNYIYYSEINTSNMNRYIESVNHHIETSKIINNENNFKNVNLHFISCNITLEIKNGAPINVDVDLRRFMISGNKILNKNFVLWYSNKFNGIDPETVESYEINIIDCNIDTIKLTVGDSIEIRDNDYLIHKHFDKIIENHADDDAEDDISNEANCGENHEEEKEDEEDEEDEEEEDDEEDEEEEDDEEDEEEEETNKNNNNNIEDENQTDVDDLIENKINYSNDTVCDFNNEIKEIIVNEINTSDKQSEIKEIILEQNHAWWTLGLI